MFDMLMGFVDISCYKVTSDSEREGRETAGREFVTAVSTLRSTFYENA